MLLARSGPPGGQPAALTHDAFGDDDVYVIADVPDNVTAASISMTNWGGFSRRLFE
jgi:hypothetical protein